MCVLVFDTGDCYVVQIDLELAAVLLPQPTPQGWDWRQVIMPGLDFATLKCVRTSVVSVCDATAPTRAVHIRLGT